MSKTQKRIFWPVVIIVALSLGAIALASSRNARRTIEAPPLTSQIPVAVTNPRSEEYVRAGRLWPQLRWHLKALGDRIEKPGKERITIAGTIKRAGDSQALPMALTLEFPDRLRLTVQDGVQQRVVTFNGQAAASVGSALTSSERELIETLVYDTAEHFFGGQSRGTATRFLGEHFRLDNDAQVNGRGPFYDVYQTTEQIRHTTPARQQTKLYCFDSDTHLLGRVTYELERNGSRTAVEIRISGWHKVQDQQVPVRIIRLENGQPALTLTITSAALSPKLDDGAFGSGNRGLGIDSL